MAVGTAAAAVPVRSITRLSTNEKYTFISSDGVEGRLVALSRIMASIQRGRDADTEGWCWEVTGYQRDAPKSLSNLTPQEMSYFGRTVSTFQNTVLDGLRNAVHLIRG